MNEVQGKLRLVREVLVEHRLGAVRLKGLDWFSWITGGGSNAVLLTAETGPADVLITGDRAFILTDAIEHERLAAEEAPAELEIVSRPWEAPERTEEFVRDRVKGGAVASDRPASGEHGLPAPLVAAKRRLVAAELNRYRRLGVDAATAMTDVLTRARPDWTEHQLAGEGARALWERGIHPALTLAAGESRLPRYRHPVATAAPLGAAAMLVFCGRRQGLYANLTRFVVFRAPSAEERRRRDAVASVEAAALAASRPGTALSKVYHVLAAAYERVGFAGEEARHHQGGTTGYLAREAIATPTAETRVDVNTPLAWNPSVPGGKIEDTVVSTRDGVEVLTVDPRWPTFACDGRPRPDLLVAR